MEVRLVAKSFDVVVVNTDDDLEVSGIKIDLINDRGSIVARGNNIESALEELKDLIQSRIYIASSGKRRESQITTELTGQLIKEIDHLRYPALGENSDIHK